MAHVERMQVELTRLLYALDKMEPAIRIERTTCGLRISSDPNTDNPTPQETTDQDDPEWEQMGVISPVLVAAW